MTYAYTCQDCGCGFDAYRLIWDGRIGEASGYRKVCPNPRCGSDNWLATAEYHRQQQIAHDEDARDDRRLGL
jgi:hypothetical protein